MIGNKNIILASLQIKQRINILKLFTNQKELVELAKEFLDAEGIKYEIKETPNKTVITKLY